MQLVNPARALFTLIDTSQWYVVADFRETELEQIRPGARVSAYVMTAPNVHLQGIVESVGSAVAQLENLSVAGVPPVARDLNWVRIAQRFPVRIALEHSSRAADAYRRLGGGGRPIMTAVAETAPSRQRVEWWQLLRDELTLSPLAHGANAAG